LLQILHIGSGESPDFGGGVIIFDYLLHQFIQDKDRYLQSFLISYGTCSL